MDQSDIHRLVVEEDGCTEQTIEEGQHIVIEVQKNTDTTVILTIAGASCDVEVHAEDDAHVRVICIQNTDHEHVSVQQRGTVGAGASVHWMNVTLGGSAVDHDLVTQLQGASAVSNVDWIFFAAGSQKQTLSARNVFGAREGGGEMNLRGVAEGKASVECNGMIDIELDGGGTDTYLTEEVLMLDPTAQVDAVPGLEIKTNDVKASHSATVSRVTDADLFYFAARGIEESLARKMYIEGFLGDMVQTFPEAVRESVLQSIDEKYMSTN